jgi:hypothetical protein
VPHSEDEAAYLFQAKVFALNRLAAPTPALADAFWSPFVVDYQGQRFGKYSPGWPFLLSWGVRLGVPWLMNALLGTLTLALLARLGGWLYCCPSPAAGEGLGWGFSGPYIGLGAAGLGLVTPGFLVLSGSLLSHTASLFWVTLTLLALCLTTKYSTVYISAIDNTQYAQPTLPNRATTYAVLTGLTLGAVFVTRPFAGVGLGLPVGIFLLILIFKGEIKWTVLLGLAGGGLFLVGLLLWYWAAVTGDPFFNAYLLVWPYDRIGFGSDIGPYGYTLTDALLVNTRLKLTTLATGAFGWPGWSNLIFVPIPFLTRQANRWDGLLLGILVSMIFVHIFYWAFGGTDGGFPRYYYDALPALLCLTLRGVQILSDILRPIALRLPKLNLGLGWLLALLVITFTIYNLGWSLPARLAEQKGKYGITAAQLRAVERANLSQPALILVQDVTKWSDFAAPFAANSPLLDGRVVYAIGGSLEFRQKLRQHFKGYQCWELTGQALRLCP